MKKSNELDSEKISIDYQTLIDHLKFSLKFLSKELLKIFKEGSLFLSFFFMGLALYFLILLVALPNLQLPFRFTILILILCFLPTIISGIHFTSEDRKRYKDVATKLYEKYFEILEGHSFKLVRTEKRFYGWRDNIFLKFIFTEMKKRQSAHYWRIVINFVSPCNYQDNINITIKRGIFLKDLAVLSNNVPFNLKPIFEEFIEKAELRKIKNVYYWKIHLWDCIEIPFFSSITLSFRNGFCYLKYESKHFTSVDIILGERMEKFEETVKNVIELYEVILEKMKKEFGEPPPIEYDPEEIMLEFTNQVKKDKKFLDKLFFRG